MVLVKVVLNPGWAGEKASGLRHQTPNLLAQKNHIPKVSLLWVSLTWGKARTLSFLFSYSLRVFLRPRKTQSHTVPGRGWALKFVLLPQVLSKRIFWSHHVTRISDLLESAFSCQGGLQTKSAVFGQLEVTCWKAGKQSMLFCWQHSCPELSPQGTSQDFDLGVKGLWGEHSLSKMTTQWGFRLLHCDLALSGTSF